MKLGASICTVQVYCENMIYCKAIQYIYFLVYSLTGWCALLSPVTVKTYLLPGSSVALIASFYLSAKRKKHFTTLL